MDFGLLIMMNPQEKQLILKLLVKMEVMSRSCHTPLFTAVKSIQTDVQDDGSFNGLMEQ